MGRFGLRIRGSEGVGADVFVAPLLVQKEGRLFSFFETGALRFY